MTTPIPTAANIFTNIPEAGLHEVFTELLKTEGLSIKRIVSRGQSSPASGWYDQAENEWVLLLAGAARIAFETGEEFHLTDGSYLHIPAHVRHRVTWTAPDVETVWLAIHYS